MCTSKLKDSKFSGLGSHWCGTIHYRTIRISRQSEAAASAVSPGSGARPLPIPRPFSGSGRSALAGAGQAGFSSSAGNSALRKAAGLPCVTCHLYCCQEQAFHWPFPEDDEELGLSFGTSSVHGSHPGSLGSVSPLWWDAGC